MKLRFNWAAPPAKWNVPRSILKGNGRATLWYQGKYLTIIWGGLPEVLPSREKVLKALGEELEYAREEFSPELPQVSEWNVSQVTYRAVFRVKDRAAFMRAAEQLRPTGYECRIRGGRVAWRCQAHTMSFNTCLGAIPLSEHFSLFEVNLRDTHYLPKVVGAQGRRVNDLINGEVANKIADYYFRRTGAPAQDRPWVDKEYLYELKRFFGKKWPKYAAFAQIRQFLGRKQAIQEGFYSKSTYDRLRRDLRGLEKMHGPVFLSDPALLSAAYGREA